VSGSDLEWAVARGAGLTAFVLLSVVVALGLALSMRVSSRTWPRVLTTELHRSVTVLALAMTGLHLAMLLVDADAAMSVTDLLVPFASAYRPLATALGILGLYVLLLTWGSTAMRSRIGQRRWRALHRVAIVAYLAALAHGILAGSDSSTPWAVFVYVLSGLAVGVLLAARVLAPRARAAEAPPAPPPATPPPGLPPLAPRPARAAGPLPPLSR
jgi:predicted ferric reductase